MANKHFLVLLLMLGVPGEVSAQDLTSPVQTASAADEAYGTRMFFGPTGRVLPRGRSYVSLTDFVAPTVQVGITNRFSLGAGATVLLLFGDAETRGPLWVTPKFQVYKSHRTVASVGVVHIFNAIGVDIAGDDRLGLAYLVDTTGGDDGSVTAGVGVGYRGHTIVETYRTACGGRTPARGSCTSYTTSKALDSGPVFIIGGDHRLTHRVKVVTENYVFAAGAIGSVGVRVFGDRCATDFALLSPVSANGFVLAPIVNFAWAFGR
jgi:hypothetical protein